MSESTDEVLHVFRPRTGTVVSALWAAVTVLWLVLAFRSGIDAVLRQLPLMVGAATLVYAAFLRPQVVVERDRVVLRNVFRDVDVPWSALVAVDTKYALTLTTTGGRRFAAWAAPAGGRYGAAKVTPSDLRTLQWSAEDDGPLPSSATLRSDAGAAAALVRITWKQAVDTGGSGKDLVRVTSVLPVIGLLLACVAGGVLALLL